MIGGDVKDLEIIENNEQIATADARMRVNAAKKRMKARETQRKKRKMGASKFAKSMLVTDCVPNGIACFVNAATREDAIFLAPTSISC